MSNKPENKVHVITGPVTVVASSLDLAEQALDLLGLRDNVSPENARQKVFRVRLHNLLNLPNEQLSRANLRDQVSVIATPRLNLLPYTSEASGLRIYAADAGVLAQVVETTNMFMRREDRSTDMQEVIAQIISYLSRTYALDQSKFAISQADSADLPASVVDCPIERTELVADSILVSAVAGYMEFNKILHIVVRARADAIKNFPGTLSDKLQNKGLSKQILPKIIELVKEKLGADFDKYQVKIES